MFIVQNATFSSVLDSRACYFYNANEILHVCLTDPRNDAVYLGLCNIYSNVYNTKSPDAISFSECIAIIKSCYNAFQMTQGLLGCLSG